jgi:hypothetical protein
VVEIEKQQFNGKVKAITAYFGSYLAHNDDHNDDHNDNNNNEGNGMMM